MNTLRQQLEAREHDVLAPQAAKSAESRGRLRSEADEKRRYEEEQKRYELEFAQAREIQMSLGGVV
jgi:hypothetical protein